MVFEELVSWIRSSDGQHVLCVCEYSDAYPIISQNIKTAALSLSTHKDRLDQNCKGLGKEENLWPEKLVSLLRKGGDGLLTRVDGSAVPGLAAVGVAANKRKCERACARHCLRRRRPAQDKARA